MVLVSVKSVATYPKSEVFASVRVSAPFTVSYDGNINFLIPCAEPFMEPAP